MNSELIRAINQISAEKELSKQVVFEAIEAALISAYRRNFGSATNVSARIDPDTGEMRVYTEKEVVEKVQDSRTQMDLKEARRVNPQAEIGTRMAIESTPADFGRIAAQTAKQVILQRIKEAERETVYQYFEERVGEILQGKIQSIDYSSGTVTVNLDRAEGVMTKEDQIPSERYRAGHAVRALLVEVHRGNRGPVIRLSRSHRNMLRRLLEKEVPEIFQGTVEIKAIAREPGQRSKVAVAALQTGVDPVGSCVGMRGMRIQAIVNELSGEKIDVVEWNVDTAAFIANSLSPAKVTDVFLEDTPDGRTAVVIVPDRQLSLAIGKEGQNARLVAKLTGWRIDIKSESEATAEGLSRLAAERRRITETIRAGGERDLLDVAEEILRQSSREGAQRPFAFDEALDVVKTEPASPERMPSPEPKEPAAEEPLPTEAVSVEAKETLTAEVAVERPSVVPEERTLVKETGEPEAIASKKPYPSSQELVRDESRIEGEESLEDEDLGGEDSGDKRKKRQKKGKKRQLVYDEEAGQVIALRRHKRPSHNWEDMDKDYEF